MGIAAEGLVFWKRRYRIVWLLSIAVLPAQSSIGIDTFGDVSHYNPHVFANVENLNPLLQQTKHFYGGSVLSQPTIGNGSALISHLHIM